MTYAIETYFLGPTNHRGARIAARVMETRTGYEQTVRRINLAWDHAHPPRWNHLHAAMSLAERLGWDGVWVEGGADRGASVWVNTSRGPDTFTLAAPPKHKRMGQKEEPADGH